jgi:hypothetical protein
MCKPNTLLLVGLPILLLGCATRGQKQGPGAAAPAKLEIKLSFNDCETPAFHNRKQIELVVEVRNVGQSAVLLPKHTHGGQTVLWGDGSLATVNFDSDGFFSTRDGYRLPPAASELAIVELRPREAMILNSTFEKPAPKVAVVKYRISKEFAERYGTWYGEVDGGSIKLE